MSAGLLNHTRRPDRVRMNYGHQLASRLGCWIIKNKPATAPAPDALQPKRPTNTRDRTVPPTPARHQGKTARHYRQTTRPAPMAQRIKPDTRQPINPRRAHRVTHNMIANPTAQHKSPFTMPPARNHGQKCALHVRCQNPTACHTRRKNSQAKHHAPNKRHTTHDQ